MHISDFKIQDAIKKAKIKEIMMLFVQLHALESVYKDDIQGITHLNSHLFSVANF